MNEVVIVSAVRTPIGAIRGALASVRPDDLAAIVIQEAVTRAGIDGARVEEVYMGCANQAGEDNRNVARMGLLLAGLPHSVAGVTFNRLCASGLNAVNQAARAIACGEGDIYVAGGVESMTRAPYSLPKNPVGFGPSGNITAYDTALGLALPQPQNGGVIPARSNGRDRRKYLRAQPRRVRSPAVRSSRAEQDRFALQSQQRAIAAINAGHFRREIVPVSCDARQGGAGNLRHRRISALQARARMRYRA
jgi:acetyl-CoA acetyltransferase